MEIWTNGMMEETSVVHHLYVWMRNAWIRRLDFDCGDFSVISVRSSSEGGYPNRCADEYLDGIEDFIEFACRHNPSATRIRCPCRREQLDNASSSNAKGEGEDDVPTPMDSAEFEQYEQLLKSANQELYPGCENFSVLTTIVELMHGKIKYRMSNLCFDYFLGVFKRMLPTDNCLPKDHRQAQKVLNGLGLGYEKIHACKNNCMLFYKEYETLDTCFICKESRFKMTSQNRTTKIP
ncbi:unnamed protein product [Prunus armeniaca]